MPTARLAVLVGVFSTLAACESGSSLITGPTAVIAQIPIESLVVTPHGTAFSTAPSSSWKRWVPFRRTRRFDGPLVMAAGRLKKDRDSTRTSSASSWAYSSSSATERVGSRVSSSMALLTLISTTSSDAVPPAGRTATFRCADARSASLLRRCPGTGCARPHAAARGPVGFPARRSAGKARGGSSQAGCDRRSNAVQAGASPGNLAAERERHRGQRLVPEEGQGPAGLGDVEKLPGQLVECVGERVDRHRNPHDVPVRRVCEGAK